MNPQSELALRDIHLPDPVSWWPPAPGWWLLVLMLPLLVWLLYRLRLRLRRARLKKSARAEIERLCSDYQSHRDDGLLLRQLSIGLRRIGISYLPRELSAGITGVDWYRQLNQLTSGQPLSDETISLLSDLPYRADVRLQAGQGEQLIAELQRWASALPVTARAGVADV